MVLSIDASGPTEFVSGIENFVLGEGAPGLEGFLSLRPRLSEIAPVEAALAAHLDEQLAKLLQTELDELHVNGIRRPVAYSLWHAVHCEPDLRVQRVCDLLSGVGLRVVRLDFVESPVVARLRDGQPQRRLSPWVLGVGFLPGVPPRYSG